MTDDFFVGKAELLKATAVQVFSSGLIPRLLLFSGMIFSIHFYDKTAGEACKVNDVISYYILKAESVSKSVATKMLPEKGFSLGRIVPEFFLKFLMLPITHRMSPHISGLYFLRNPKSQCLFFIHILLSRGLEGPLFLIHLFPMVQTSPLRGAWGVFFSNFGTTSSTRPVMT